MVFKASKSIKRWCGAAKGRQLGSVARRSGISDWHGAALHALVPAVRCCGRKTFALWTPRSPPERVINSEHDPATEHKEKRSHGEWKKLNFYISPKPQPQCTSFWMKRGNSSAFGTKAVNNCDKVLRMYCVIQPIFVSSSPLRCTAESTKKR